jgi:hypothetical protein
MKIELIEEKKFEQTPWYEIRINGKYVWGSYKKDVVEKMYDKILADPEYSPTKITILKSDEIDVSLQ